ncbi:MAG: hypothetical protein OHK0053_31630 [Microscillaceae bacterium]
MKELVSVVITAYNAEAYLGAAIESTLDQTYPHWELILVNDGSQDNTLALMESYAAKDSRIRVLSHENRGISASNNRALEVAQGVYFAKLDADDTMVPERLEKQLAYLQQHPEVTMLSCQAFYINPKGKVIGVQITPGYTHPAESRQAQRDGRLVIALHSGFMTYMEKMREVGGYREDLPCVVDLDLYNRMVARGNTLIIMPDKLVHYRMHLASVMALTTRNNRTQLVKAWLADTYRRQAEGKPARPLEEFRKTLTDEAFWRRWSRRCKEMSYHYRRNSIIHYGDRNYPAFVYSVGLATALQPAHTFKRIGAWLKRKISKS